MEKESRIILEGKRFQLMVERLCHELIEQHGNFEDTCLIGIQPRGPYLGERIIKRLSNILGKSNLEYGTLDVTFHRDDFRRRDVILIPNPTQMDFIVEKKKVVLLDDVLYTGRTIRAALNALQHFGRPSKVELAVLVDRRFNRHLPIFADYKGMVVDTVDKAYIKVEWEEIGGKDKVTLHSERI